MIRHITNREEFQQLKESLGVRFDWHEPDEQYVTVEVHGSSFDNAGFPRDTAVRDLHGEITVVFLKAGKPVAMVLLANLCYWASEYYG